MTALSKYKFVNIHQQQVKTKSILEVTFVSRPQENVVCHQSGTGEHRVSITGYTRGSSTGKPRQSATCPPGCSSNGSSHVQVNYVISETANSLDIMLITQHIRRFSRLNTDSAECALLTLAPMINTPVQ